MHVIVNIKKLSFYRIMLIYLILDENNHKSIFLAANRQKWLKAIKP